MLIPPAWLQKRRLPLQDDFFAYPLDTQIITSYFGYRRDPLKGDRHFHNGVDFSARIGEAVMAFLSGRETLMITR